jgi:pyruvate dehydrogenase E2 component (dihydrolipoamide acetyltransferase)
MVTEIKLPELGEEVNEGDIVAVLVSVGDRIERDQNVVEIETDKATLEVPCSLAGTIVKVHVTSGDRIKVGDPIVSVEADAEAGPAKDDADEVEDTEQQREGQRSAPQAQRASAEDEPPETTEADSEAAAPAGELEEPGQEQREDQRPRTAVPPAAPKMSAESLHAAPNTRLLARELGVDLGEVAEQHADERLTDEHIKRFVRGRMNEKREDLAQQRVTRRSPPLPDFEKWGPIERVPLSALERRVVEHLTTAWAAPHVTHHDLADIGSLEALRASYAEQIEENQPKLTVTAVVIRALVHALRKFPKFNASLDPEAEELILKHYYHIGVAVDTEYGLVVPVLRDCDKKPVLEIADELEEVAERARQRKVTLEELRGGTFTVTNVGGIGGTAFSPVVNFPEVAILGVARARREVVLNTGQPEERLVLPLCLSFDHRAINGADAARFTREIVRLLEAPLLPLLHRQA